MSGFWQLLHVEPGHNLKANMCIKEWGFILFFRILSQDHAVAQKDRNQTLLTAYGSKCLSLTIGSHKPGLGNFCFPR